MFKKSVSRNFAANPFNSLKKKMRVGGQESQYFSLNALNDKRTGTHFSETNFSSKRTLNNLI